MADIHIERQHKLGLPKARKLAFQWAEQAEAQLDMACTYEEGQASDTVGFERSGVSGTLEVTASQFVLQAKLGFLLSAFKGKIEGEISKNLDALLQGQPAAKTAAKTAAKVAPPAATKLAAKVTAKAPGKTAGSRKKA
ncbi:MAG: polyhydroxyalkanoic acid system family protein [Burkholderiaceae bacterium]